MLPCDSVVGVTRRWSPRRRRRLSQPIEQGKRPDGERGVDRRDRQQRHGQECFRLGQQEALGQGQHGVVQVEEQAG